MYQILTRLIWILFWLNTVLFPSFSLQEQPRRHTVQQIKEEREKMQAAALAQQQEELRKLREGNRKKVSSFSFSSQWAENNFEMKNRRCWKRMRACFWSWLLVVGKLESARDRWEGRKSRCLKGKRNCCPGNGSCQPGHTVGSIWKENWALVDLSSVQCWLGFYQELKDGLILREAISGKDVERRGCWKGVGGYYSSLFRRGCSFVSWGEQRLLILFPWSRFFIPFFFCVQPSNCVKVGSQANAFSVTQCCL